jgi:biopolymer transport protein TolQ
VIEIGRASVTYQQDIYLPDKQGSLLCQGRVKLVVVDKNMRPTALPIGLKVALKKENMRLTAEMSLWSLISNASFLVKLVMLVLLAASVISWTIIFQRGKFLRQSAQALDDFENAFWSGNDINKLYSKFIKQRRALGRLKGNLCCWIQRICAHEKNPCARSTGLYSSRAAFYAHCCYQSRNAFRAKPILVGNYSINEPICGIIGTVWGIMHSFRQLGAVQQASLAMVAPGISEALIATAMG